MFVHGDNLEQKEQHKTKYRDATSRKYLAEIRAKYDVWKKANETLKGPLDKAKKGDHALLRKRVILLNEYKDFIDKQKYAQQFDSRSNLHSSVLEEFMYYLFRDLVASMSASALIGKSHTFKDLFFLSESYEKMLESPRVMIERKDHDFAIGVKLAASFRSEGSKVPQYEKWDIPAVAIECKTYLDKTMLQDASTASEQVKYRNPSALYVVVAEWLKLTESVNLRKSKIDQVYVLRKQKNTDREFRYDPAYVKNPIYDDVVINLFDLVRTFLTSPWEGGVTHGLAKGILI
ncbi:MAG: Bpu10I family restriction endonuclease [Gammaproteobacteria bacterium]